VEEVAAEVIKDKAFYDYSGGGVTFSGGEVLLQWDFAEELAKMLQNQGVHVAVETAGAVPETVFASMLETVDYVLMDLKHWDSAAHKAGTGVENGQILKNLQLLQNSGVPFLIRIPVIPGFNDSLKDGAAFARLFKKMEIKKVQLLPFHRLGSRKYALLGLPYAYADTPTMQAEALIDYSREFARMGIEVML
jgi:pyruvate formate lyase activating enzyme